MSSQWNEHEKADPGTILICALDKNDPPDHSFVEGMLARSLPAAVSIRVLLLVGGNRRYRVRRYGRAILIPRLSPFPWPAWRKIAGMLSAMGSLFTLIRRARAQGRTVAVLVRNDPLLLVAASLLRGRSDRLVFQSSYPLEESHSRPFLRVVHRLAYRLGCRRVTGVLAVSPIGLKRVLKHCPRGIPGAWIPLMSDLPSRPRTTGAGVSPEIVRFVYIGTLHPRRCMKVVLEGITKALATGVPAVFDFIGGTEAEIEELLRTDSVREWWKQGRIRFQGRVRRAEIAKRLGNYDVGLSLIPDSPLHREASPTKIAEYLGAGIAVLASSGIALQEVFVSRSGAGVLVPFDADQIARGINEVSQDRTRLEGMKRRAYGYARDYLTYGPYVAVLRELIRA